MLLFFAFPLKYARICCFQLFLNQHALLEKNLLQSSSGRKNLLRSISVFRTVGNTFLYFISNSSKLP